MRETTQKFGMLALCVWLILTGLANFGLSFPNLSSALAILAIIAGVLIFLGR